MDKLLKLLDTNARMSNAELAVVLGSTEEAVAARIAELERSGVIRSYKAVIDWERTDRPYVTALIELRVTPKRDLGFEGIAEQVMQFDEVESVDRGQNHAGKRHGLRRDCPPDLFPSSGGKRLPDVGRL